MATTGIATTDMQTVQAMVDLMVGIPKFAYPANKNAPKPVATEFAHIKMLEEYPVGIPDQRIHTSFDHPTDSTLDTITYRTRSPSRIRMRIGIVETSGVASMKIAHGWTSEAMKALMIKTGYGFIKVDPISLEDGQLEKEWEPRQGFSVEFYVTRIFEETVSTMNSVIISGGWVTPNLEGVLESVGLTYEINE